MPDFFADDILIDATKIPVPIVEAPSDNFLLHLTGEGDAIAMCVFENREQDVKVMLSEKDNRRIVTGSEIDFGESRKIWVALLEAPQIWHALEIQDKDARKIMPSIRPSWSHCKPCSHCRFIRSVGIGRFAP